MSRRSNAPCSRPSSPNGPCSAMKQNWMRRVERSRAMVGLTSMPAARTPNRRNAPSTAAPVLSEIARSFDQPPFRTATRIFFSQASVFGFFMSCSDQRQRVLDDLDLGFEIDVEFFLHQLLGEMNQIQ